MCIAVVGGMARLQPHYQEEAERFGVKLKLFNTLQVGMAAKLRHIDALVIFTNKVSHSARREAVSAARGAGIPILQVHSCGVCTLRDCFRCLLNPTAGASLQSRVPAEK